METLSQMLQSPAWWISTVAVALVINLLSSYLWGRYIERWLSGMSEKRRKRSEEEKTKLYKLVKSLSEDPTELMAQYIWGAIDFLMGVIFISTSTVMFSTAKILRRIPDPQNSLSIATDPAWVAIMVMVVGIVILMAGVRKLRIARTALALRREDREKGKRGPFGPDSEQ